MSIRYCRLSSPRATIRLLSLVIYLFLRRLSVSFIYRRPVILLVYVGLDVSSFSCNPACIALRGSYKGGYAPIRGETFCCTWHGRSHVFLKLLLELQASVSTSCAVAFAITIILTTHTYTDTHTQRNFKHWPYFIHSKKTRLLFVTI